MCIDVGLLYNLLTKAECVNKDVIKTNAEIKAAMLQTVTNLNKYLLLFTPLVDELVYGTINTADEIILAADLYDALAEYESLERKMFELFMENINIKMQLRYFFRNQENMSPQDIVAAREVLREYTNNFLTMILINARMNGIAAELVNNFVTVIEKNKELKVEIQKCRTCPNCPMQ